MDLIRLKKACATGDFAVFDVSRSDQKIFFLSFSHYKYMGANDPRGRGQFGPQGLDWQDFYRGPLNIATY